jgi:hypothetical protein
MATGSITLWNDGFRQGLITEDGDGVHVVDRSDCTPGLLAKLAGKSIPNDPPLPVTFDVSVTNHAINVDG